MDSDDCIITVDSGGCNNNVVLPVSGVKMLELEHMKEKALTYQSVLRYLEPRVEMKMIWRNCVTVSTNTFNNITNTIK